MEIDLSFNKEYEIDNHIKIPYEYYKDSEVQELKPVYIKGKFFYHEDKKIHAILNISGTMILLDSISLKRVEYPFSILYDDILEETLKKDENKLDLFEFLWENIVLEIPLKFTKVLDLSKFHGDGWKLISEEDKNSSRNPFNDLLKNFDKKE